MQDRVIVLDDCLDKEASDATRAKKMDKKKRWANLFSSNRVYMEDVTLQYIQPLEGRVVSNSKDADSSEQAMGHYLMKQCLDRQSGWKAVKNMINRWQVPYKLQVYRSLWLHLRFDNVNARNKV